MSPIEAPDLLAARLKSEAARRGVPVHELIAEMADDLPAAATGQQRPGYVALGASTGPRHARNADEMLAESFGR